MKRFLLISLVFFLFTTLFAQEEKHLEVKISVGPEGLPQLGALGLPAEEGYHDREGYWTIVLSQTEVDKVIAAGYPVEVIHPDYLRFITERNLRDTALVSYINSHKHDFLNTDLSNYTVPQHFKLGSMGGYLHLAEVYRELDSMRLLYPQLISQKFSIGNANTIEGRPVYCVRISNQPNQTQNKPRILYNALIHAREPMGMQQLVFYMWYLLENYASSEEIRYLVDNLELYFIPVANPDGYEYNHSYAPIGGGDWRKNRRNNGDGTWGVDLNRNFGYKWGYDNSGSSPNPGDVTYRGTAPFSEPETQIIRDFSVEKDFRIAINYHTYSNYVLYPWCWQSQISPDSTLQLTYADFFTKENGYLSGMPGTILYNTNGDAMDWQYGEQSLKPKTIAFTVEVGKQSDGFWPQVARIIPLAQENMYLNLMAAHFALRYAEVRDVSPVITNQTTGYFRFEFKRFGMDAPASHTVSIRPLDTTQIIATGEQRVFTNPAIFQVITDSIAYTLDPSITTGTAISFVYRIDNGFYTYQDTVTKFFGPPLVLFADSCSTMDNWSSMKWNISSSQYHSAPGSITDSPSGNYPPGSNYTVTTNLNFDLRNSPVAVLNYYTKWKTENGFDFVQMLVSDDNGLTWTPKSGRYTVTGTEYQKFREPVYDGKRYDWVKEEVIMQEYQGKEILLRFILSADNSKSFDGFYFDDVALTIVDMTGVGVENGVSGARQISDPVPNPATTTTEIGYNLESINTKTSAFSGRHDNILELYDARGLWVRSFTVDGISGKLTIFVGELPAGIYHYRIRWASGATAVKKLVVIH